MRITIRQGWDRINSEVEGFDIIALVNSLGACGHEIEAITIDLKEEEKDEVQNTES